MISCLFASDLHGSRDRYLKLFDAIREREPGLVFLGGDLLPPVLSLFNPGEEHPDGFLLGFLAGRLRDLRARMKDRYPSVFLIPGNDDPKCEEAAFLDAASEGIWTYAQDRSIRLAGHTLYGYCYVPPSPFLLKDWEKYDVSRYVDPGCVSPEEGRRTVPVAPSQARYSTIQKDLESLAGDDPMDRAVFLFHSPPHDTDLDVADLAGKKVDHAPLDVHVGSIAIRRFIERRQPLLTMHGHVHESARLTGSWRGRIGRTQLLSAAHDGPELSLVGFDLENPSAAVRELL